MICPNFSLCPIFHLCANFRPSNAYLDSHQLTSFCWIYLHTIVRSNAPHPTSLSSHRLLEIRGARSTMWLATNPTNLLVLPNLSSSFQYDLYFLLEKFLGGVSLWLDVFAIEMKEAASSCSHRNLGVGEPPGCLRFPIWRLGKWSRGALALQFAGGLFPVAADEAAAAAEAAAEAAALPKLQLLKFWERSLECFLIFEEFVMDCFRFMFYNVCWILTHTVYCRLF